MNFSELLFKDHLCKSKNDINFLEWQFSCYVCVRDSYPTEPKMVLGFTWRHMKQNLKLAWVAGNARSLKGPWVILLDCPPVIFLFWVYARDPFVSKHRLGDWMTMFEERKCLFQRTWLNFIWPFHWFCNYMESVITYFLN